MTETPREIRENLIMQWYEKKLNRDELLRVLWWIKSIDKESRKKIEKEIIENFYANYEKAKTEKQWYQWAEELYRGKWDTKGVKWIKNDLKRREYELENKRVEVKKKIEDIKSKRLYIAEMRVKFRKAWWWERMTWKKRFNDVWSEWNELKEKERVINDEILKLSKEKKVLEAELNRLESQYWSKIDRKQIRKTWYLYEWMNMSEVRGELTLKWYKDKYEKMLKDKEEYKEKFLEEMGKIDIWITGDKKKEIMSKIQKWLDEDLENLEKWDRSLRVARDMWKWLEENDSKIMEELSELGKKISEKEEELEGVRVRKNWVEKKDIFKLREEEFKVKQELIGLKQERNNILAEYNEKYEMYYGMTYSEMMEKMEMEEMKKRNEAKKMLKLYREELVKHMRGIDIVAKRKIIQAANNIPLTIEKKDGRLVEFKLWKRNYKLLDVSANVVRGVWCEDIKIWWIMWDDVNNWENKELKEYVKKRQGKWLHVPKVEEMKELMNALWEEADLQDESDQIAMLMYLTGMYWHYWLSMWSASRSDPEWMSRCDLACQSVNRGFCHFHNDCILWAGLCMIACD